MKVVFILGPTASGKSKLALELAEKHSASIINADSVQFYEKLQVGAAKPEPEDLRRVPHHLVGTVSLKKQYTAADFRSEARHCLFELEKNAQHCAFIVGGSGFYVRALLTKMYPPQTVSPAVREQLRLRLHEKGLSVLYHELKQLDPDYAEKISPRDQYRVLRALEVLATNGEKPSRANDGMVDFAYPFLKVGLYWSRQQLRTRVESRTQKMLSGGKLIEEVRDLMNSGWEKARVLNSVGYKEAKSYLNGNLSYSDLFPSIVTSTMQLAKRQMTWFRKDPDIHWFHGDEQIKDANQFVTEFLKR